MILEERRVFVLHPQMIRMEPSTIVGSLSRDHWDGLVVRRFIASRSLDDFPCPSLFHRLEQINSVAILVRINHILRTVSTQVDKPNAMIVAVFVHDSRGRGQSKGELGPVFRFGRPRENGLLLIVADDQLATAVLVQIKKPDALVPSLNVGSQGLAV